ncbi:MAG: hypothetical protein EF813_01610 [Methanosarcinales archaeon]|nr:MAG: hypothetical protein EF813_01610 [Methanosarcinales archaeon]
MKRDRGVLLAVSILVALCIGPIVVSGHALVIDYRVDSICVEAYYGGMEPTPVQYADVEVFYPDGRLYIEDKTDKDGMFRFDPKFEKEWLVVVESTGHKDELTINMTATGGMKTQGVGESPLYLRVFAGLGYLLGILGISLWYKSYKQDRKSKDR